MKKVALFIKSHVSGYTKKDGTVVQAHEDRRQAAKPKPKRPEPPTTEKRDMDFLKDQIANDENSSDEEIADHVSKETGMDRDKALAYVKHHRPGAWDPRYKWGD